MTVQRHRGKEHSNGADGAASTSANGMTTRQKELELRRLRGEISCAECRRLKLKCDKKMPCSSCIRRGCQTICPLGERHGGQSGRLVLADTVELRQTIVDMSNRIRQLEDALQIEHDMSSTESHPLLRDEFHIAKEFSERGKYGENKDTDWEGGEDEDLRCAMGLLTVSEGGNARYLGATGSDQALLAEVGISGMKLSEPTDARLNIPEQLIQASQLWPFRSSFGPTVELHVLIEAQLPSRERASGLGESFLINTSFCGRPVTREQIMEELIPAAYKRLSNGQNTRMDLHDLALLYMIFAAGAAADLTLPPYNAEAERYRHLARAALGVKSVFDGGSLSVVQAIFLMGTYDVVSGRMHSMESAWKMFCLASSLSASIGLHRDPARWHLDPKTVYRRRVLFWEMCWVDNWKSLSIGRPISLTPDASDCEFPEDRDAIVLDDGTVIPSFWALKHQFAKKVLSVVAVRLCAARPPKYSEILEMDRQVREFDLQPIEQSLELSQTVNEQAYFSRRFVLTYFRDRVLLYIHRNYFARALSDYPNNPLKSPFSPSFLAAYSSATSLLRVLRHEFATFPHIFLRNWPVWAHALVASVVVGSVVTRSPRISLAPAAFVELEQAIKLFKTASEHPILQQGVPFLIAMYEQAKTALESVKTSDAVSSVGPNDVERLVSSLGDGVKEKICGDVLKILMGSTRMTVQKDSSRSAFTLPEFKSTEAPSLMGTNGSLRDGDVLHPQYLSDKWPYVTLPGDYGGPGEQEISEVPGWQNHSNQAQLPTSTSSHTNQAGPTPMNGTNDANGRTETSYLSVGGIDFRNLETSNSTSGFSSATSSSTPGSSASQQAPASSSPPINDTPFLPMEPYQYSDFMQRSASLPDVGSSLPLIDPDSRLSSMQTDDPWQSFMSDSGFQTVDELMRSWQVY